MNRRRFLFTGATSAAALSVPGWLATAFAAEAKLTDSLASVSEAYRAAQRAGKPLLIIVIPTHSGHQWARGQLLGAYLNFGTAQELAPLALCEVVCARLETARQLLPMIPEPPDGPDASEPLYVLAETDAVPATVQLLLEPPLRLEWETERPRAQGKAKDKDATLAKNKAALARWRTEVFSPEDAPLIDKVEQALSPPPTAQVYYGGPPFEEPLDDLRVRALSRVLERGLGLDAAARQRRADQALRKVGGAALDTAALLALSVPRADALAAVLWQRLGTARGAHARALTEKLAAAATARLKQRPVPGARWARGGGCGTTYEDAQAKGNRRVMVACGMGHVPEKSRRFLSFYAGE